MKAISNIRAVMAILIFFFLFLLYHVRKKRWTTIILTWIYSSSN